LRSLPLKVVVISPDQGESVAQIHTAQALLESSNQIILGAYIGGDCEAYLQEKLQDSSLGDESRVSRPDILIKVGVNSKGIPQWAPVDIKNHAAFDSENKSNKVKVSQWNDHLPDGAIEVSGKLEFDDGMQLAHYHAHLLNLGLASPDYLVGIVGREYQAIAWAHLDQTKQGRGANASTYISTYHQSFLQAEKVVRIAIERNRDEAIEAPVIAKMKSGKFGCSMCEFRLICMDEMEKFDNGAGHITLLARVTAAVAEKDLPGIESIRDLVSATGLSDPGEKARRRARAWQSGKPELVDPSKPLNIPQFDIEVDI
jgi:predicted RecB family nuclease